MATVIRTPFVGQISTFNSPEDPNVEFDLKRCGVAENLRRQDTFSTVRYIDTNETGKTVTEREFPTGTLMLETIAMVLTNWNLTDEQGLPIKITRDTIRSYLTPKEFSFLYEKALEVNPMWGDKADDTKNA